MKEVYQTIPVDELHEHPKNEYFFDKLEGRKYADLVESIRESGVINPPIVTPSSTGGYTIVSGHQRIRACRELGIIEVTCVVKEFENEDAVILALIDSNIRQRGVIGGVDVKNGRILVELERIFDLTHHNSGKSGMTRRAVREKMGLDMRGAQRCKTLNGMSDTAQNAVENQTINATTAYEVLSKLSHEEQEKVCAMLNPEKRYSRAELEEEILKSKDAQRLAELEEQLAQAHKEQRQDEVSLRHELSQAHQTARDAYEEKETLRKQLKKTIQDYEARMDKQEEYMDEYIQNADVKAIIAACNGLCKALEAVAEQEEPLYNEDAREAVEAAQSVLYKVYARLDEGSEE